MEFRYLDNFETEAFLSGLIASGRTVPFIGTGFTRGERAKARLVPDGQEWMEIMRQQISCSTVQLKPSDESLKKYDFQKLSDAYFRDEIVDLQLIKTTLDHYFSDVHIATPSKLAFLAFPWPYIYTLNIDDGIERAINGVKVVPYEPFGKSSDRRYVYKMHGDVFTALKAKSRDDLKLIFGKGEYIKSLNKNRPLIDALKTDLNESNLIFIGCSLTDEIDVLYALSERESVSNETGARRVYLTSSSPEGDYDIISKLREYNITDVIICNYDDFYLKTVELAREIANSNSPTSEFEFTPTTEKFNTTRYLQYFLQSNWTGGDSSHLSITRDDELNIKKSTENNSITAITGARFSGRTSSLYKALRTFKTKKLYFISSESTVSENNLSHLLSLQNSFIVFDTESLNFSQIRTVCRCAEKLSTLNSTVLLAIDKNDLFATEDLPQNAIITLGNRFSPLEKAHINSILDTIGIARIQKPGTMLDYIYQVADSSIVKNLLRTDTSLKKKIDDRVRYTSSSMSKTEFGLLYILAAKQKVLSLIYRSLLEKGGFRTTADEYISTFVKTWAPFIENSSTGKSTMSASHSSFALTSNSQAWLFYALRSLASALGISKSSGFIVETISSLKAHEDHYELMMFDVLNAIFSGGTGSKMNSRAIITEAYKGLSRTLSGNPNYWLQRAKSIYHDHLANTPESVLAAIEHAEKAISETDRTVTINARLTKANLYGLLCHIEKYQNSDHYISAINCYFEAIKDYHLNKEYLDELIQKNRGGKGYLKGLLSASPTAEIEILKVREKASHLRSMIEI